MNLSKMSKPITPKTMFEDIRILKKGPGKLRDGQTRTPFWDLDIYQRKRGKRVQVKGNCVVTNKPHSIIVYSDELDKWLTGKDLIQDALRTDVSADDREFLMTGISPEGWETIFPKTGMSGLVGDEIK